MHKPNNPILFATNLSESCRQAFLYIAAMASRLKATIILLHVIEKMPEHAESRLRSLLGQDMWQEIQDDQARSAQEALIGKKSSNKMIKEALAKFCSQVGVDDDLCGYHSREIVVSDGEVVDDILETAEENNCGMIVMATKEGFLKKNTLGTTIKSVMRRSKIPVMVVPPTEHD